MSIVSKAKKNRRIRTKNMQLSQAKIMDSLELQAIDVFRCTSKNVF